MNLKFHLPSFADKREGFRGHEACNINKPGAWALVIHMKLLIVFLRCLSNLL